MNSFTEYSDRFIEDSKRGTYRMKDCWFGGVVTMPAARKTFNSANILEVTAATTGFRGGDAGHGCRTMVCFNDLGGTAIKAKVIPESIHGNGGATIMLAGDCELITLIEGLRFAADTLEILSEEAAGEQAE